MLSPPEWCNRRANAQARFSGKPEIVTGFSNPVLAQNERKWPGPNASSYPALAPVPGKFLYF